MQAGSGNAKQWLGLVLLLITLGSCNRAPAESNPSEPPSDPAASNPTTGSAAADGVPDIGGFRSTPINPTRTATLVTQAAGAQINLRSLPTTQSPAQGSGLSGDQVTLLRLAEGEGGFSWYYVKFAASATEGWVRGDFIDTSDQAATTQAAGPAAGVVAPAAAEEASPGPCGANRPEAFFETQSFTIHLCQTPQGLSYIGTNTTNQDTLTTTDVRNSQGTYIAINGDHQYYINDQSLVVYQISNGSYTQLESEAVVRHERFLY